MSEQDDLAAFIDVTINEEYDPGDDVMGADLAPAILAAGYGKKAAAWDEGYMACLLQLRAGMPARNPYASDEPRVDACPPREEGAKPHCPDCSGIVGETGIVW